MTFYIIMQKSKNLAPMASSQEAIGRCALDKGSRKQGINPGGTRTGIFLGHCKTTMQQVESSKLRLGQ